MIPKIIHYCWFGRNPLPPLATKCISSWKKYLPDYEIKEWNEDNFDINAIEYTKEAYSAKKYAFVSDYARFWILYQYGGLYFDTDVEIVRPIDAIVKRGAFMGCETNGGKDSQISVAPGLGLGFEKGNSLLKELIDVYTNMHFLKEDGTIDLSTTIVGHTTNFLVRKGLKNMKGIQQIDNIYIYPSEFFCPINVVTDKLHITSNTRSIHHYAATWQTKGFRIKKIIRQFLPERVLSFINTIKNR